MKRLASTDRALLLPAWAAADGLGQLTLLSLPFMLGTFVENVGLGPREAGLLLSLELFVISLACMSLSVFVARLPKRAIAVCGAALAVVGNALSIRGHDWASLAEARALAGVGYGIAMAVGNAAVATAADPPRLYDSKMMLFALTQLLVGVSVPTATKYFGAAGCFGFMIVMNLLMIPLILRLPSAQVIKVSTPERVTLNSTAQRPQGKGRAITTLVVLLFAVTFAIRESAYWGLAERFGAAVSVDASLVGLLVGIGTIPSVFAPRLVTVLRARFGEIGPTLVGVLLEGAVLFLLGGTNSKALFISLVLVWPIFYCYTVPLVMGVAARLDRRGRIIALAAGALQFAFAIGPAIAGALVEKAGLRALGPFALASTAILLLLTTFMPGRRVRALPIGLAT